MDEMKLLEAVGAIDDVVLKKALSYRPSTGAIEVATFSTTKEKQETQNKKAKSNRSAWIKWVSIAACFCLMFASAFALIANFVSTPSADGFIIEDKVLLSYTGNDKNVVIPEYYEGKKVTSIGENAFKGANILSVVMPNSIATINKSAFESCDKLANVTLSSGLKSIGENAFWGCSGLTSITLPSKVSSIGDKAFNG